MNGVSAFQLMEWWNIPRRGWIIILTELAVIIGLASWAYSEYLNNTYFQGYMNNLSPVLVPIVSVGLGITSATAATLLYFTMKNMRRREEPSEEDPSGRRGPVKKTVKKPLVSAPARERGSSGGSAATANPRVRIAGASRPRRAGTQPANTETTESE